jgi:biopolymer transport protein ExbB
MMGRLSDRIRLRLFLLTACALMTAYAFDLAAPFLAPRASASAQAEDKEEPKPKEEKTTPKEEPKPASGGSSEGGIRGWFTDTKDLIVHMIVSVGCFFGPLLAVVSIVLVALIVLLALDLRMGNAIPGSFVEEFTDTVNKRKFKEAYDMAREDSSYVGRVLATGMSRLQYGIDDAREAAFNMVDSIRAGKEQPITYLATIASLGPLLGLVGTVFGMIQAFLKVSQTGDMNARAIADKISHALVVTMFGVALAVPAIFCHALFRNRLNKIALETGNVADDLLTQMYHNSKKQGLAPPSVAPSAAPVVQTVEPIPVPMPDPRSSSPSVRAK